MKHRYNIGDVIYLSSAQNLDLTIAPVYYNQSPTKESFEKNHINWWQDYPISYHGSWGARTHYNERVEPSLFIVDHIANSPEYQGYVLLLTSKMINHHPELDPHLITTTIHEETRLHPLLRHLSKRRKENTDGIFAFVPFDKIQGFSLALSAVGQQKQDQILIWQEHYDDWFHWNVLLEIQQDSTELPEIAKRLVRDTACYKDIQGLKIKLKQGLETIADISIHQRAAVTEAQSREQNKLLDFSNPVIDVHANAAEWTISAQLNPQDRSILIRIAENQFVPAL